MIKEVPVRRRSSREMTGTASLLKERLRDSSSGPDVSPAGLLKSVSTLEPVPRRLRGVRW